MIIQKSEYEMSSARTAMTRRTMGSRSTSQGVYLGIGGSSIGTRSLGMAQSRAFAKGFSVIQCTGEDARADRADETEKNEGPDFLKTLNYELGNHRGSEKAADTSKVSTANDEPTSFEDLTLRIRFQTLNYLFKLLYGKMLGGQGYDMDSAISDYMAATSGVKNTVSFTATYEEYEETSFSTSGKVVTADGRELDFGIDVTMSRAYMEQSSISLQTIQSPLMDPLVIQLDGNVDSVSDQKFYFDLDCDGTEDEISMLNPGSGFLALDKNGNGIIDDGSELFGTRTGHGFAELAEYDLDGNGWIDEADEIFDKLRIWSFDEDGNRQLFTLKEKDVGAICLRCMDTEFSMKNQSNRTNAVVRETGFYLKEDGTPFTMQQLDLAM